MGEIARWKGGSSCPAAARQADATESSRGAACTSSRADRDEGRGWRLLRDMGCDCGLDFFKLKLTSCANCRACPGVAAIGVRVQTVSGRRGPVTGLGTATSLRTGDRHTRHALDDTHTGRVISDSMRLTRAPPSTARHEHHAHRTYAVPSLLGCVKYSIGVRTEFLRPLSPAWPHSLVDVRSSIALRLFALFEWIWSTGLLVLFGRLMYTSSYGIGHCISSHRIALYAISSSGISNGTAAATRCLLVRR